jgi:hypothetical protein
MILICLGRFLYSQPCRLFSKQSIYIYSLHFAVHCSKLLHGATTTMDIDQAIASLGPPDALYIDYFFGPKRIRVSGARCRGESALCANEDMGEPGWEDFDQTSADTMACFEQGVEEVKDEHMATVSLLTCPSSSADQLPCIDVGSTIDSGSITFEGSTASIIYDSMPPPS